MSVFIQVGGFICIVGRPFTHKPSTCPQSTVYRSPGSGGTRQYKHLYSKRDHWSRLERIEENGSLRVLQKSHKLFLSGNHTKRYNCPFLYHQLDLTSGKHSGSFEIRYPLYELGATKTRLLKLLSLSGQKDRRARPCQSFFWYNTNYRYVICTLYRLYCIVSITTCPPILLV